MKFPITFSVSTRMYKLVYFWNLAKYIRHAILLKTKNVSVKLQVFQNVLKNKKLVFDTINSISVNKAFN